MTMVPSPSTPLMFTFPETAQHVRSVMIDGEPWFVGKDASDAVGISKYRDALAQLDADERVSMAVDTPGGAQQMTLVSEAGVYALMLISRSPKVKSFRRWLTHDVLPALRQTGAYSVQPPAPRLPDLTTPQGVLALAQEFTRTAEQLVEADRKLKELEPKALAHDTLMAAQDGDVLVRQAAKILGWKERDLRAFLLDEHLIYRRQQTCGGWEYDFYAAYAEQFNAVKTLVEHSWGSCAHYTLHVTPRGLGFVQMRIGKRQSEMRAAIEGGAA
ncbi:BRO family protein [Streptomyces sp. NBC_01239]|uniref:phage antirepressor n=1 Tax=Streptomyces sp. NBC_01239 TaxID=2903792 RepID=UPI00224F5CF8|nr:BRO family protein [Streptomyces sp. NBC_01239]MCX4809081.1 BRO family protein [Streptomyces sp. NBC_01239]MCX4818102.1 BRO family protein [Streptomyces sp. NBC_01239]